MLLEERRRKGLGQPVGVVCGTSTTHFNSVDGEFNHGPGQASSETASPMTDEMSGRTDSGTSRFSPGRWSSYSRTGRRGFRG